jgi:hypothetical protein
MKMKRSLDLWIREVNLVFRDSSDFGFSSRCVTWISVRVFVWWYSPWRTWLHQWTPSVASQLNEQGAERFVTELVVHLCSCSTIVPGNVSAIDTRNKTEHGASTWRPTGKTWSPTGRSESSSRASVCCLPPTKEREIEIPKNIQIYIQIYACKVGQACTLIIYILWGKLVKVCFHSRACQNSS